MRRNLILVTSLIAAIALAAIILPLEFVPQNNKIQAQAQTQANTVPADNQPTSPPHDMTKMMAGQDNSMDSDQSNGMQDNDTQNAPLSKTSDNVTVDFVATPIIQTNKLASIQIHVKNSQSGAKLSHVDWAITVKDPDGNIVYKTTTGHSHTGNMGFNVVFPTEI